MPKLLSLVVCTAVWMVGIAGLGLMILGMR
jgi:hypothetical protein